MIDREIYYRLNELRGEVNELTKKVKELSETKIPEPETRSHRPDYEVRCRLPLDGVGLLHKLPQRPRMFKVIYDERLREYDFSIMANDLMDILHIKELKILSNSHTQ